jgi:hypothetical protein
MRCSRHEISPGQGAKWQQCGGGVPPLNQEKAQSRDGSATSPSTSSPEGAKESSELPKGYRRIHR